MMFECVREEGGERGDNQEQRGKGLRERTEKHESALQAS